MANSFPCRRNDQNRQQKSKSNRRLIDVQQFEISQDDQEIDQP